MDKKKPISVDILDSYLGMIPLDIMDQLTVEPILSAYGGFALVPKDNNKHLMCLKKARNKRRSFVDFSKFFNEESDLYNLSYYALTGMHSCVLLPNKANTIAVDWDMVDYAMSTGAHIKPHPLVDNNEYTELVRRYGKSVLYPNISSYSVIAQCNRVFVCSSSETSLYSILADKKVTCIDDYYKCKNTNIIKTCFRRKTDLNYILNSPESGIFITHVSDLCTADKIQQFVKYFSSL
jgi:hypothetical protein